MIVGERIIHNTCDLCLKDSYVQILLNTYVHICNKLGTAVDKTLEGMLRCI